jgi:hypothetical protein
MKALWTAISALILVLAAIFRQEVDNAELKGQIRLSNQAAAAEIARFRAEFFARLDGEKAEREKREDEQRAALDTAIKRDLSALPADDFHTTVNWGVK